MKKEKKKKKRRKFKLGYNKDFDTVQNLSQEDIKGQGIDYCLEMLIKFTRIDERRRIGGLKFSRAGKNMKVVLRRLYMCMNCTEELAKQLTKDVLERDGIV